MNDRRESWREVVDIDGWELVILVPDEYELVTDVEVTGPTGDRYLGSIGTPEMVRAVIDANPQDGPFWMSDLVLVDELDHASVVRAVAELIGTGDVARAFDLAPPDDDPVDDPDGTL